MTAADGAMNYIGSYYRARYYDPGRGRFVSEDPIGIRGRDTNVYGYAKGSPVRFTDPTGLITIVGGFGATGVVPRGTGFDVSVGGYLDTGSRDIGGFRSTGEAVGLNVSGDVFFGLFRDLQSLQGSSENATVTIGPFSVSVMTDPATGRLLGGTIGIGPSALPVGASSSLTRTVTGSLADLLRELERAISASPRECQ